MNRSTVVRALAVLAVLAPTVLVGARGRPDPPRPDAVYRGASSERSTSEGFGNLPMSFESNRGQADPRVSFLSRGTGYTLFLTANEAVFVLLRPSASHTNAATGPPLVPPSGAALVRQQLVGASPRPRVAGQDELPGKANYFVGSNPAGWRTRIPTYSRVRYSDVYPGVDLVYHGDRSGLEYDFVVAPGARPDAIRLGFQGVNHIEIDAKGDLVLRLTGGGELRQRRPIIYQDARGARREITGGFVLLSTKEVGFRVGEYEVDQTLVIDPSFVYSTFLGGSGEEGGRAVAVDGDGNAYVTGTTASADFPDASTLGCGVPACSFALFGGYDVYVGKLNAAGSALLYATYLGGGDWDLAGGIAVDGDGNAHVTGMTLSGGFPTTTGAVQEFFGGGDCEGEGLVTPCADAFVTKLDALGSALIYSSFLGGSNWDFGSDIAVDLGGNAYVTGSTESEDFPRSTDARPYSGGGDAFVTKLNAAGSAMVYSTYLGGDDEDVGYGIAAFGNEEAYAAGLTRSKDFPTTLGVFDPSCDAGGDCDSDGFIVHFGGDGGIAHATYVGGSEIDVANGIAVDGDGNAYATGNTTSDDLFTTPAAPFPSYGGGFADAWVYKLDPTLSVPGYATYLGGADGDWGQDIAVDDGGNAYVAGVTGSKELPPIDAPQPFFGGGVSDAFVTKLNAAGSALLYFTFLGGENFDQANGIAVDGDGSAYVTGITDSVLFPTEMPFQAALNGPQDAFVTKLGEG